MFYGAGAGKLPTASAVVSDVVDAVRHLGENVETKWSQENSNLYHMMKYVQISLYVLKAVLTDSLK